MRRFVVIVLGLLMGLLLLGLGLTWLSRSRDAANHAGCANNLRMLSLMGARDAKPAAVWPGTLPNAALAPDQRLSWVVLALPMFDGEALKAIDLKEAWNGPANQIASTKMLGTLICPAMVPTLAPGEPAPTMYVGIAGLGQDAATLPVTDPRAGAFRYDAPTPMDAIIRGDGVSQTFLFGQTVYQLGPWIRGGRSTVRGLADEPAILARNGGQFGGSFNDGAYFSFCDGHVSFFRYGTDPKILKSLATIHDGKNLPAFD